MTFEDQINYNCKILLDNGQEYKIFANQLHNQGLDNWQGWHCDAGVTRLFIDSKGNVYDGECKNSLRGNLNTTWNLKDSIDAVCLRSRCTGCTDDLITTKFKIVK